jgi:3-deoxy-manno-octulosonate cytidylyltransferase (CMP-KDO synthetase)
VKRSILVVIPARYGSTRFPGKALANLGGKSVLRRCYERVATAVSSDDIVVATDDARIADECDRYRMRWLMTKSTCLTGTDRVAEVASTMFSEWYINVQGDEPFLDPNGLRALMKRIATAKSDESVFNAYSPISSESDFRSATVPKVIVSPSGVLLYISRAAIPTTKNLGFVTAYRQIGLYAFRQSALREFSKLGSKTPLEELEDIEILRFLELGYHVQMIMAPENGVAIDTPQDLVRAQTMLE